MSNRIGGLELLFWSVVPVAVSSIVAGVIVAVRPAIRGRLQYPVNGPFAIVLIVVSIVVLKSAVSRFHDLGWPGWLVLLLFVPLLDIAVFLFLLFMPGERTPNSYGEPLVFLRRLRKS
jgi:uncharacterized membrane protein YhaH (DUF805 family)